MNYSLYKQKPIRTLSVTSGKGGVGKSTLVSNLSVAYANQGERVLILDGDIGMGNMDVMFGKTSTQSILSVVKGEKSLSEIILNVAPGIDLIPGGSGLYELTQLNLLQKKMLLDQVSELDALYTYLIIDTAPGIDEKVLYFNSAAQNILILISPDPSSLVDSYALIKLLFTKYKQKKFSIVCNMVRNDIEGINLFRRIDDICGRFLSVNLTYRGSVPFDHDLRAAVKQKKRVIEEFPRSVSSLSIKKISSNLAESSGSLELKGTSEFFWQRLIEVA